MAVARDGGAPSADKPTVTFAPPPDPDTVSTTIVLRVPDCHAAYDLLCSRGGVLLNPPHDWDAEIDPLLPARPGLAPDRTVRSAWTDRGRTRPHESMTHRISNTGGDQKMTGGTALPVDRWPALPYTELAPTVDYLRRLVQIGAKYTLDQTFEPSWGNIVLDVTPRGLSTPTLRVGDVTFRVHYRLLDSEVALETSNGTETLALRTQSVADFYAAFVDAAAEQGLPAPGSAVAAEIPGALSLDTDPQVRPWHPDAARLVWAGFNAAADALEQWQAPYRGHRPRTGVMWGGFDLSATRYRGAPLTPPADRPAFMQHSMIEEEVALGFSFGSPDLPMAAVYAYIAPQPDGLAQRTWGPAGATWLPEAGLAVLPWHDAITAADPAQAIIDFADAGYAAAVDLAGWAANLVGPRFDGWHASHTPPAPGAL